MNRKILSTKITTTITILFGVLLLFNFPSLAQVSSQVIPRIEVIEGVEGVEGIPPSYRLVISRSQDNVYVFCPTGFEPQLDYLRDVEAIQCSSQVIPRIEVIESPEEISPSYRLVISRPQDIVYVSCPTGFEPQLDYLRNVKAIQCKPYTSP
ncbi:MULTISPECIES: hypothetical protein [Cyanophyceae]|uniref:hypothetical protein n=1 Tax=Cyanophyceae TaxID=3028117 RepID=UPI001688EA70|nr:MULTISPECIES: hypothetical protein [Cyanophyceae]MBD1919493.1 hypothetical protein [Phormidium sp. FACHB-77]MBD2054419.1 hypothetical protein [Leptolyngbya sp. FACHB-60]